LVWGLVFGVALWGLLLADLQFPIFAAAVVVPYGLVTLALGALPGAGASVVLGGRWRVRAWLAATGLAAVIAGLALMWFAGPLPYILRFQGELVPGPVGDRPGIPFPGGFLSMAREWWEWDQPSLGAFFPMALLVSLLAGARIRGRGTWMRWFWLACAVPPLVFALGPFLQIGSASIPLPFIWFYDLTNGMFRMPWRLAPIAVVAATAFIGLTWTARLRTHSGWGLWGGVLSLLLCGLAVRLGETRPLDPILPGYTFYQRMGEEQGEPYDRYVVVEAPTGMGTGEVLLGSARGIQYQYYGTIHHKRMVNGFISRTPIDQFYYIETGDPLLSWLGQRVPLDADRVRTLMQARIFDWPIGYFVLHIDDIGRNTSTPQEIIGYFNQQDDLLCPMWIEGDAVVYRTRWHPDGCPERTPRETAPGTYLIDLGISGDERFIGWGWHWQEDVGATQWRWTGEYDAAALYVDVPAGAYTLTAAMQAFWEPRQVQVLVNGVIIAPADQALSSSGGARAGAESLQVQPDGLQIIGFSLPADVIGQGRHVEIRLEYDDTVVPVAVGQSGDPRRLAVAVDWVELRRGSAP
jgi:hypothetical protein